MSRSPNGRVALLVSALAVSLVASSPAAQQSLRSGPLAICAFTLRFDPAGTFALSGDGWPSMAGTWTTSGREVTLQSQTGPDGCTGEGRYTFSSDGARVSFSLIDRVPTPLAYRGVLYVLANNGVFDAYEITTGKELYRQRLPLIGSGHSESPVAADGKIRQVVHDAQR